MFNKLKKYFEKKKILARRQKEEAKYGRLMGSQIRNNRVCKTLDNHFNDLLGFEIARVEEDTYHLKVWFDNRIFIDVWNGNRPYSWLCDGGIYYVKTDNTLEEFYSWKNKSIYWKTMYLFDQKIKRCKSIDVNKGSDLSLFVAEKIIEESNKEKIYENN
jgi:hypothetical protein